MAMFERQKGNLK